MGKDIIPWSWSHENVNIIMRSAQCPHASSYPQLIFRQLTAIVSTPLSSLLPQFVQLLPLQLYTLRKCLFSWFPFMNYQTSFPHLTTSLCFAKQMLNHDYFNFVNTILKLKATTHYQFSHSACPICISMSDHPHFLHFVWILPFILSHYFKFSLSGVTWYVEPMMTNKPSLPEIY
jgi:hypothetical protein